jgi:TRAP-type C4-dicarboxylate transport system permease small subunit
VRLIDWLERRVAACVVLLVGFFVGATFLQVVLRYGFASSLPWVGEATRYAFIWVVFLASVIAIRRGQHIAITVLEEIAPRSVRFGLLVLADLAMIAFAAVVGIGGAGLVALNVGTTAPATGWSMAHVQLILPLFGILASLFALVHLAELVLGRSPPGTSRTLR